MIIQVSPDRTVAEINEDFNRLYPFLKCSFYPQQYIFSSRSKEKHLGSDSILAAAGLVKQGYLEIRDDMSVKELERKFLGEFGLMVQVARRSGLIWLETTMTDHWTLVKQNEYGRETSTYAAASPEASTDTQSDGV